MESTDNIIGEASLLRIFISTTDKFKSNSLYEVIVYAAKRFGLAGATVLKGSMGYGGNSSVNTTKFWEITEKLPLVVEIVDETKKIEDFTRQLEPYFSKINSGYMITMEKANIIVYQPSKKERKHSN